MSLNYYLILSAVLFFIGVFGVIRRKNLLMLFFSTEIMLNAVNIGFVAISKYYNDLGGQMFAFFIIAVAASEVAIGLGLLILWYKKSGSLNLDDLAKITDAGSCCGCCKRSEDDIGEKKMELYLTDILNKFVG